ncbi:MAG: type II toxin-antitoxin system HicB family antitoxin [Tolypothrix sp. Co-bin9]|nr:type II toxin-antitoxin system HicB family antitoxin [Tolypothrix sp. Co-bin9]
MNLSFLTSPRRKSSNWTYDVLIEDEKYGGFSATVIGLPDCKAIGATKEEALTSLYEHLTERLAKAEIVSIKIEPPKAEHPWMKFAGMFKDDPQFDDMLADIEAYRRELDAEMEEYYRKLDAEDEAK